MQYKKFINSNEGFKYSINLELDFMKLDKIKSYIVTKRAVKILDGYLKKVYYPNKFRATVLIGPYGKGKSHLLLILLSIVSLYGEEADSVIEGFIEKVKSVNPSTAELIKNLRKSDKKLLPIIVNSNNEDLSQSLMIALKNALTASKLDKFTPNTYYSAASRVIEVWENEYKDTAKRFAEIIKPSGYNIKNFKESLERYDKATYELFKEVHPRITSGAEFNPLINSDIKKLYSDVNSIICENTDYTGMFIVFDEFSKFIEGNLKNNSGNDIKVLQELVELANDGEDNQVHFACITHKNIGEYMQNLPKSKVDTWRTVEGRFEEIYFTASSSQNYELIGNTINKDDKKLERFLNGFKKEYNEILTSCHKIGLFDDAEEYEEEIGLKCFPINPIATFVLPRVSEKVAQNERTLFTFLSKDEVGSLVRFVNSHEEGLKLLTIDWIYDYFEVLFKKEVFNENIYSTYLKALAAIERCPNENEKKIIKAIAIILIVNDFNKLPITDSAIRASLEFSDDEYTSLTNSLLSKHVLIKKKSNGYYGFLTSSDVNVKKAIDTCKETKVRKINVAEIVNDMYKNNYLMPTRYNAKYRIRRFFRIEFMTAQDLENVSSGEDLMKIYSCDGVIINLIYLSEEEKLRIINKIKELGDSRLLLNTPKNRFERIEELKELKAITYLKADEEFLKQDEYIIQELNIHEEDLRENIANYIKKNYEIENKNCELYGIDGIAYELSDISDIRRKISDILTMYYGLTPIINNEMINKNAISTQILKARSSILKYIFEDWGKNDLTLMQGGAPEATIFRATIKNKGLLDNNTSNDEGLNKVLSEISKFISSTEQNKTSFKDLFVILKGKDYGMRSGVIPIYIAYAMKDIKENCVIYYKSKEVPLSVETLNKINSDWENYYLLVEKGTNENVEFLNNLEALFHKHSSFGDSGYNKFSKIVEAMQNYMQSLPKYTRAYTKEYNEKWVDIDSSIIDLRKELLKFDLNPREFLFSTLGKKIFKGLDLNTQYLKIKGIKEKLDNHVINLKNILISKTKNIFKYKYKGELGSLLKSWHESLNKNTKEKLYDSATNSLLNYIGSIDNFNENKIIERLAFIITNLSIEDWNDNTLDNYLDILKETKEKVESYKEEVKSDKKENTKTFEIVTIDGDNKDSKRFDESFISKLGQTLFNELEDNLDSFSESIDENEKRNILMKLMKKYM